MTKRFGQRLARINDRYRDRAELDAMTLPRNAIPQLEVVAKIIYERLEATDLGEIFLRRRHYGAEHEIDFPAEPVHEHARGEIRALAHRLEAGSKRTVGEAAIQTRDA